jgi:hypothetical protein
MMRILLGWGVNPTFRFFVFFVLSAVIAMLR